MERSKENLSHRRVWNAACAPFVAVLVFAATIGGIGMMHRQLNAAVRTPYDGTIWNNPVPASDQRPYVNGVEHSTYHSTVMNVEVGYTIYLPPSYMTNPTERLPVIYFLHARGGNENDGFYGFTQPVIYVFPNGGRNSKYMDAVPDSPMDGVEMVETTIINELIPHIDATYRTVGTKHGRAIQGFSMGGHGALRLAFKYPQLFSSVFSFAAAIDDNYSNVMAGESALMAKMFNNNPSLFDAQTSQTIATTNAANIREQGLAIHMSIGSLDSLLPFNQALDSLLTLLKITHEPLDVVAGSVHAQVSSINSTDWAMSHFTSGNVELKK